MGREGTARLGALDGLRGLAVPAYWFALAGSFALLAWLEHPLRTGVAELPVFLLFGQNYLAETAKHLDPPMWSLAVEVSFYAALPLVGFLALRAGPRLRTQLALCGGLAVAGVVYTALSVARAWPWTATATLPIHLSEFAAGMAVAVMLHRRELSRRAGLVLLVAGGALVTGDALWHELTAGATTPQRVLRDLPAALGFGLIVAGEPGRGAGADARPDAAGLRAELVRGRGSGAALGTPAAAARDRRVGLTAVTRRG